MYWALQILLIISDQELFVQSFNMHCLQSASKKSKFISVYTPKLHSMMTNERLDFLSLHFQRLWSSHVAIVLFLLLQNLEFLDRVVQIGSVHLKKLVSSDFTDDCLNWTFVDTLRYRKVLHICQSYEICVCDIALYDWFLKLLP